MILLGSQTSLLEEFENDQTSFKEKILNLITDDSTKGKESREPFTFDEDHKCILLDVGRQHSVHSSCKV